MGTEDDVMQGTLVCGEPTCRHEYPIIAGIPVIMPELRRHLSERVIELLLRDDLTPAVMSLVGDALGPDSWFDVIRQGVSTYAWDGYADLDPLEQPGHIRPGAARRCLAALLALGPSIHKVGGRDPDLVLDLGCGAGRTSFELAGAGAGALVLGVDSNLGLLRLAQRVAMEGAGGYARRRIGTVYDARRFEADLPGRDRVDFWACDALALPFAPAQAELVVGLNVLDCVTDPRGLLAALAKLTRPGGRVLLATPFDWATRATPVAAWLGGHSQRGEGGGAAEPLLRSLVTAGAHPLSVDGLRVLAEGECAWHTRLHDRSAVLYQSYLLALERLDTGPAGP